MNSTEHCKSFIATIIKDNPSIVLSIYGMVFEAEFLSKLVTDATTPNKWKREYKCKPGGGLQAFDEYSMFSKDVTISRMGYDRMPKRDVSDFISERGFCLAPDTYEDSVAFVVLEDHNGILHLGDYIGD